MNCNHSALDREEGTEKNPGSSKTITHLANVIAASESLADDLLGNAGCPETVRRLPKRGHDQTTIDCVGPVAPLPGIVGYGLAYCTKFCEPLL